MNNIKKINKIKLKSNKKLIGCLILTFILLILLIIRIFVLQFIEGNHLKQLAYEQQIKSRTISAKRGTIYDSTGNSLSVSSSVDTVSVNKTKLKYSNNTDVDLEFFTYKISEIFGLDYTKTLEKISSSTSSVKIAEKVEKDKITLLKTWLKENKITSGINIDEDTKRYYPYNNLASNLIGFTGTDNHGLWGLEESLDEYLSGVPGKLVTAKDSANGDIPNQQQTYIEPQDGNDIALTININVQSVCEKYLSQAVSDNNADGGNVIVMNPSTGDILAMATYPDYDLNTPSIPINEKLLSSWDSLTSEEKTSTLFNMWNNSAVQSTYEPGSTFKLITAAAALEENIVEADGGADFVCTGSQKVADRDIKCWRYTNPHGYQNLTQALGNSCNPAFIQLGLKVGPSTLYKYYNAFGLFNKTNSFFYGESNSIFHDESNLKDTEVATMSFGQRINITPIQLITAASAIANEGVLMQPRIVKEVINSSTGSITTIEPNEIRQVISKETSETMMQMLEYVVISGTGQYAQVSGYSVGGKSGTSEPIYSDEDAGYVASFIGFSPIVNTQVVVLVTIYDPKGDSHQGGQVAGPVVSQILSEILPSLGIASNQSETGSSNVSYTTTTLPDVRNKTVSEAKEILSKAGFNVKVAGIDTNSDTLILNQTPKPGVTLIKDSIVFLYTDSSTTNTPVAVPNLKGMSAEQAINSIKSKNLNISINGKGIAISQDIASGKEVEPGTVITVNLQQELSGGY